jgi:hypothetical protein
MVSTVSRFPYVCVPSALVTDVGRGWQGWHGLPTAAFAISHSTAGELPDSTSLARLEASLSRLINAVTLFLTTLYRGPRPRESLLAIRASVLGRRYTGSDPSLTVMDFKGAFDPSS